VIVLRLVVIDYLCVCFPFHNELLMIVCFITFHPDFPSCAFIISLANLPGVFIGPTSLSPHPFFSWKRLDFPQPPAILPAIYPSNILELPLTALSFNFMTALTH
jgi:hypothetical protein